MSWRELSLASLLDTVELELKSSRDAIKTSRHLQNHSSPKYYRNPTDIRVRQCPSRSQQREPPRGLQFYHSGFNLHKGAFRDALALRYGWTPPHTPTTCECGTRFSVEHALSCPRGAFPIIRHNEVRDLTASLLTEVCQSGTRATTIDKRDHVFGHG